MKRFLLIAALTSGCAATYSHTVKPCPPTWALAVDFVAGAVAAGAAVAAYNASPTHDGALASVIVAETFWWTAAVAEDRCRR